MRMIADKVLVRMRARQEQSKGGIVIPERAQRTETWGEVRSAGSECKDIKEGDLVYVGDRQGTHLTLKGEDFIIVTEPQIICKLED